MKRSIPFGNISRPISCPGAVLRALSILAYLDNRLTLQHRCALQCCPLFWVSLPAFWPFFFVICYFFWGDEGNLHLACWPGSRLRGSRPFVPGLSLWPDLQFAVYSMPFFFSLSFASFLFFFFLVFCLFICIHFSLWPFVRPGRQRKVYLILFSFYLNCVVAFMARLCAEICLWKLANIDEEAPLVLSPLLGLLVAWWWL